MANTDTANAKQYATLAQVAAAQAKLYSQSGEEAVNAAEIALNAAAASSESSVSASLSAEISASQASSASESASQAAEIVSSTVKQQITFTSGGTLYNALDRISDGTYLYYWTGTFPKVVPPGSSVNGTGGIGLGFWACDTDIPFRGDLSKADGYQYVGKCQSTAQLRSTEPSRANQTIILERCASDCPVINEILYYDSSDTTSPDDNISIFVTPGGARWKANISNGYNVYLAGLKSDGSNFSSAANTAVNAIVNKIVAAGRVNDAVRQINVPAVSEINILYVNAPIKWPTIVSFVFFGSVYIECSGLTTDNPFYYQNSAFIGRLTSDMFKDQTSWPSGPKNQATGRVGMTCIGGEINIRGPGYALDTSGNPTIFTYAFVFGNDIACDMDVRDVWIEKINVMGFYGSHVWGMYNTFMCGFRDFNFSRFYIGMETKSTFSNSGERMWYTNGTFGNGASHCFLMNGTGDFTLENVSCDFMGGDLFHFGPLSPGEFKYLSGHIEGINGYISAKDTPASYSKSTVYIAPAVKRDPRRVTANSSQYRGIAKDHSCPSSSYGQMLIVTDASYMPGRDGTKPNTAYPTMAGEPANTGVNLITPRSINSGTPWPNSYSPACSNRVNTVIGFTTLSTGDVGGNLLSTDYAFAAIKTGSATCQYGTMSDATSDGYMPFIITLTNTSESVQLFCTNEAKAESGLQPLWGSCSIKIGTVTGSVLVATLMASYLRNSISTTTTTTSTFNSSTSTVTSTSVSTSTSTPIQRGITASTAVDMTALKSGSGLTSSDYQAMYPASTTGYYQGNDFFLPGFSFTGFVGTIYVKLPIWWFVK